MKCKDVVKGFPEKKDTSLDKDSFECVTCRQTVGCGCDEFNNTLDLIGNLEIDEETLRKNGWVRIDKRLGMLPNIVDYIKSMGYVKLSEIDLRELIDVKEKYYELIMSVGNKYAGETRHETALKYIKQAEIGDNTEKAIKEQANELVKD
uniref:Uncharacterized protein n=1 Tax=viral metagenome TaxID=1070528 RepID=A0A6M3KQZ9_9ZZZZ